MAVKPSKDKAREKFGKSGLDTKRIRETTDAANESASGKRFFKFPTGKTRLRLITHPDTGMFCYPNYEVYVPTVVDGKEKPVRFVSPKTVNKDEYCPATETAAALERKGEKAAARQIRPSRKYLCPCMVFDSNSKEWEPKLVNMPLQAMKQILAVLDEQLGDSDNPDDVIDHLAHAKNGCSVTINKAESGGRTEYSVVVNIGKKIPVKPEWIQPLDAVEVELLPSKVEDIEKAICEWLDIEDISDVIGADSAAGRKTQADEDDEDDEEEGDEEEGDEEEEEEDDEFSSMNRAELKAYIKKNNLEVRVMTGMSDDDIRVKIREAQGGEEEEEEEEEEEYRVPPKKKGK